MNKFEGLCYRVFTVSSGSDENRLAETWTVHSPSRIFHLEISGVDPV